MLGALVFGVLPGAFCLVRKPHFISLHRRAIMGLHYLEVKVACPHSNPFAPV